MRKPVPATILAVDPGRSKSGIAVVSGPHPIQVLQHSVVESSSLTDALQSVLQQHPQIMSVVMGNGTGSEKLASAVREQLIGVDLVLVDEHGTSEQARARFVAEEPLPLLQRLLPRGLRSPDRPYDDYVAIILAERYFEAMAQLP